jgi:hypothetical protein
MKKIIVAFAILLFATFSFAQDAKKDDWIRVQSDDGEFSIEVPADYGYFYDKDGLLADFNNPYNQLDEMRVFNSYKEHTLISFECYKVPNSIFAVNKAITEISRSDVNEGGEREEFKKDGFKITQIAKKSKNLYMIKWFIYSKHSIYMLLSASRSGETETMKHFFNSLIFKPDTKVSQISKEITFSDLKQTLIVIEEDLNRKIKTDDKKKSQPDVSIQPFSIVFQPLPIFTTLNSPSERAYLEMEFSEIGQITKLITFRKLKSEFLRSVQLSALRLKYLPEEKDGKPIAVKKIIKYDVPSY